MTTAAITMESRSDLLNKVPEVTVVFWIIKIMSTTVGETGADYLAVHVGSRRHVHGGDHGRIPDRGAHLAGAVARYVPWIYWLTVVLVSVVGTQITDSLTDKLGISLYVSTAAFAILLCADLRRLVSLRAYPVDPHDRYNPARALLLGRHPVHVRVGHRRGRPDDRGPRPWFQRRRRRFRRADRRQSPPPISTSAPMRC